MATKVSARILVSIVSVVAFTFLLSPTTAQFFEDIPANPQSTPGANQQATTGNNSLSLSNASPQDTPGANQPTIPGASQQAFPGSNQQATPGDNSQTFPNANPQATLGSNAQTVPGVTQQAIPGSNPLTPSGTSNGINQQPGQQGASCAARFEAAVTPKCFDANGVNFTGVIYLLSANRSGAIPTGYTYQTFVQFLCTADMKDKIIPCVLGQMQEQNTTQCSVDDRALLLGRGGQLLTFMEAICGQPCEQDSTQGLIQCYAAVNMNPEHILSQNASIAQEKFSIMGANETEFNNFCGNRQKLFSCLGPLSATCPALLQQLYTIGWTWQAMETVTGFVCADKQKYLQGLSCYNSPSQDMTQCAQTTTTNMQTVISGRFQTGTIPPSKYMDSLCKAKLSQMSCEVAAYTKSCDADSASLRTSVECGMLPKPCRESPQLQTEYNTICQKLTTPAPVQTVRPTQGKPGAVPVDGGATGGATGGVTGAASVRTSKSAADNLAQPIGALILTLIIGVSFTWS